MTRGYIVHTFGCQMNEHDSERIAGLMDDDGYVAVTDEADADIVVLNTCCIRENADNKLYGTLGWLKPWKEQRDGRQIVVAGCLAQKDRDLVRHKAPWVDVVLGTHNVHRTAELVDHARTNGPITEILDEAVLDDQAMFPSALPGAPRDHLQRLGHDSDRLRQLVRLLHRAGRARRRDQPTVRRGRRRGRPARVGGCQRGHAAWSERQQLRPGSAAVGAPGRRHRGSPAADVRGAARSGRRRRRHPPRPLHQPASEGHAHRDVRSDGGNAAVCEHLHYPLQSGSDRVLAAMHRGYTAQRYLERLAAGRAVVDDLAVSTDIIVGFPGETDDDFAATLEVAAAAEYDYAYTFIFSPRPGTEAARDERSVRGAGRGGREVPAAARGCRAQRAAKHEARVGRIEEVLVEGPSKKDPAVLSGRTRQNKLVHFVPPQPLRAGAYARVEIVRAAPHHLVGEFVDVLSEPLHKRRIAVLAG